MRKLTKSKILSISKSVLAGGVITLGLAPVMSVLVTSCSDNNVTVVGNIDGTNWSGRIAGSFAPDDYTIDYEHKIVTYKSAVSIHSYNLILPNYVIVDGEQFHVDIASGCFANNSGIAGTVEFNDFISVVPANCFYNCVSLTGLVFHTYPIQFGNAACGNCFLLSRILIVHDSKIYSDWASQVVSIGDYAFFNCILDGDLVFGPHTSYIGVSAFENCIGITSANFTLCSNLTSTSVSEFGSCSLLTDVYLSSTMTTIEDSTFRDCGLLKTIHLPINNMPITIKNSAFYNCKLFENFSRTPNIRSIGTGAFTLTNNLQIRPWEPEYGLHIINSYTFSSCKYSMLKFWPEGPDILDYAFSNNTDLSVLDFTEFYVKPNDGEEEGEIIVPDWHGQHIFMSSNIKGGTIYLPSKGVLNDGWISFFARNDIKLSTDTSADPDGWRIKFGAPRIESVEESEQKTARIEVGSQTEVKVTFTGFKYTMVGELDKEELEKRFFASYAPYVQSNRAAFPTQTKIILKEDNEFDLQVTIDVSDLLGTTTIGCPLEFFYMNNKINSPKSNYTIELIK